MNKIGILLTSPKEVGGIYQYSLSIIEALTILQKKKKFKNFIITQINTGKSIYQNCRQQHIFIKVFFKKFLRKLIYLFSFNSSWPFIFKEFLNEEVKILNKSDCDLNFSKSKYNLLSDK